jgi:hypothetical protein
MRSLGLLVLVLAISSGCDKRGKDCQKALDYQLEQAPKNIEKAVGASESAPELRAQGEREVKAMREKFVDVCKKADKFDPTCYTDPEKHKTEDCRKMTMAIDTEVLGPPPTIDPK